MSEYKKINLSNSPLVTVYITTFNRLMLLKRALRSVLNQDYENFEIIIVDDGSNDGTVEYLENISRAHQRVRVFFNKINSGACFGRNKAISEALGDFITGLDDDDYFEKNRLSNFVSCWDDCDSSIVALCSNQKVHCASGKISLSRKQKIIFAYQLIDANWIGNQIFTRTEYLREIGGFDLDMPAWQDLECWYRLLKKTGGAVKCVKSPSYVVDISHPHERISSKSIKRIKEACDLFIFKHHLDNNEQEIMRLQLRFYMRIKAPLRILIRKVLRNPSLRNFKQSALLIF